MFKKRSNLVTLAAASLAMLSGCESQRVSTPLPNPAAAMKIRTGLEVATGATRATTAKVPDRQPTGWATLRGVFKIQGTPPPRTPLTVNKDEAVCAPGGRPVLGQQLLVDASTGGIANVVVYADKVPASWVHDSAKPGKTDEIEFDQKKCIFLSHVLAMQSTQKLKILNSDPVGHNTNLSPKNSAPFNQTIPSNSFAYYQPQGEEREPFSVVCSIHPWMQAWIITRDNSYVAVTRPDGSFEIPNLPAGVDLQLRVWQEKAGFLQDVTVNAQPTRWPKGKMTVMLDAGDENISQIEVAVDASVFQ